MKKLKSSTERGVTRRDFLRNAGAGFVAGELAGASPGIAHPASGGGSRRAGGMESLAGAAGVHRRPKGRRLGWVLRFRSRELGPGRAARRPYRGYSGKRPIPGPNCRRRRGRPVRPLKIVRWAQLPPRQFTSAGSLAAASVRAAGRGRSRRRPRKCWPAGEPRVRNLRRCPRQWLTLPPLSPVSCVAGR